MIERDPNETPDQYIEAKIEKALRTISSNPGGFYSLMFVLDGGPNQEVEIKDAMRRYIDKNRDKSLPIINYHPRYFETKVIEHEDEQPPKKILDTTSYPILIYSLPFSIHEDKVRYETGIYSKQYVNVVYSLQDELALQIKIDREIEQSDLFKKLFPQVPNLDSREE